VVSPQEYPRDSPQPSRHCNQRGSPVDSLPRSRQACLRVSQASQRASPRGSHRGNPQLIQHR
jgi:hypothetical protein